MAAEDGAQVAGPGLVEGRARRVLGPGREHDGARPGPQGGLEVLGDGSEVVDGDRHRHQPHGRDQVEHARVARVLDGHGVARGQVGGQDPLDAVQGAAHHRHALAGDPVLRHLGPGPVEESLELGGFAIEAGAAGHPAQGGAQVGEQGRIGVARGQVARSWGQDVGRVSGQGWAGAHARAPAAMTGDDAALAQGPVGGGHRGRADTELLGQGSHRRQGRAR